MVNIKKTKFYTKYREFRNNFFAFVKFFFNFSKTQESWRCNEQYLENLKYEIFDSIKNNNGAVKIPRVMSIDETLKKVIYERKSVARYGDGEFILLGNDDFNEKTYFNMQKNPELIQKLQNILKNDSDNVLVCVSNIFGSLDCYPDSVKKTFRYHMQRFRKTSEKYLNFERLYGDALITRFHSVYKNQELSSKYFNQIKQIWDNRDIVIIEGNGTQMGVGNDLFANANNIERIICPAENSYSKYQEIYNTAIKQSKEKLILIALGMTATVLAYELAQLGYQAIDIGHIDLEYEWFITGTTQMLPVKNKYINDIGKHSFTESKDDTYIKQIIHEIK